MTAITTLLALASLLIEAAADIRSGPTSNAIPSSERLQFAQRYRPPARIRPPLRRSRPKDNFRQLAPVPPAEAEMRFYFHSSQPALFNALAQAITGEMQTGSDGYRRGEYYFDRLLPEVRSIVCGSEALRSFMDKGDVFAAASLIAEMISARFELPKATATMAVLAARIGLRRLCPSAAE